MLKDDIQQNQFEELARAFANISLKSHLIDANLFQKALGIEDKHFATRAFSFFDTDNIGVIDQKKLLKQVKKLVSAPVEKRLLFAFRLHDRQGSGYIDQLELKKLINDGLTENRLTFSPEQVDRLVAVLFKDAGVNQHGKLSFTEFERVISQYPDLMASLSMNPIGWLKPRQTVSARQTSTAWYKNWKSIKHYFVNNSIKIAFLTVYWGVNLWLGVGALQKYAALGVNFYVQIARAGGAILNFNGALILLPMMRNFLTWLRKTRINNFIPIDESIQFHKLIGYVMFIAALVHTGAHFFNYTTLTVPFAQSLFGTKAGLTGVLLLIVFTVMVVTALEPIRKGGYFKIFYLAHLGYFLWFLLLLFHGPVFWEWALVSGIGFGIEKIILRSFKTEQRAYVANAYLLPSKVLEIEMVRPPHFHYEASDYLFLKCPGVSHYEWHPFTISSAPENKQTLTVHIRAVGSWTNRLHRLFEQRHKTMLENAAKNIQLVRHIPLYIDGPYGTSSSAIFKSKYAILIGSGIGVTPFASILKSILRRKQSDDKTMRLQKVHFFWINRDQKSFEWFLELLSEIEENNTDDLFDIHIYLTGVQGKSEMKSGSFTLFIAMDLLHAQTKADLITGLKTRTQFGRPNWAAHFKDIAREHTDGIVDVYFCGAPGLAETVKQVSDQYHFNFHKENF